MIIITSQYDYSTCYVKHTSVFLDAHQEAEPEAKKGGKGRNVQPVVLGQEVEATTWQMGTPAIIV